jgi:hypothetical protein
MREGLPHTYAKIPRSGRTVAVAVVVAVGIYADSRR